jgi:transposase
LPPLGRLRWPIERTQSWLKQFRRLRIRWERLAHLYEAFLLLGCCLIAWKRLRST